MEELFGRVYDAGEIHDAAAKFPVSCQFSSTCSSYVAETVSIASHRMCATALWHRLGKKCIKVTTGTKVSCHCALKLCQSSRTVHHSPFSHKHCLFGTTLTIQRHVCVQVRLTYCAPQGFAHKSSYRNGLGQVVTARECYL